MAQNDANENPSKIRPRRIEFVKFLATDYRIYAPPGCSVEEAGRMIQDLIVAMYDNTEPEYAVNKAAIDEAREYIGNKHKKIEEWKKKKYGQKAAPPPQDAAGPNLFSKKDIPKDWQNLPRHELEKIMLGAGITAEKFHIWYEDSAANDFYDRKGNPIRDPIAACRSYSDFTHKKESEE